MAKVLGKVDSIAEPETPKQYLKVSHTVSGSLLGITICILDAGKSSYVL